MAIQSVKNTITLLGDRLKAVAAANAVVAKPVSVGDRHVVTLCELGLSIGGGGGSGEGQTPEAEGGRGFGAAAGGGAKASPVAVLIVDGEDVRLEKVGL